MSAVRPFFSKDQRVILLSLYDYRKITTFCARISQTTRDVYVTVGFMSDMNKNNLTCVLHPSRIDLAPEIRLDVIRMLNQSLACTVDLRSHVRQACWNIKGKDFVPLHALFTTMTTDLDAYANMVAERIAALGGVVMGTARTAALLSQLTEYPANLVEGETHVAALAERFAHYATVMRSGIALASDVEDAGSAAVYTDISRGVDKQLWILEAHLHR